MKQFSHGDGRRAGVQIGDEVDPAKIAGDAVIRSGCRISGAKTSIGPGCVIGDEAPAVLENCQLGRNVKLKGGYFSGAVFFDGANLGSGAHVRAGTILEEEAGGAHAVGLKQTILLPFVTAGSLINFCDVLMAGGTSRKDHSEIGSSYIHFNFTPHQDKATASLVGEVPRGVFLDQRPIFLGGQGGLVGPARIAYGCVVAAGGVCREDLVEENQLHVPEVPEAGTRPYQTGAYRRADRLIKNNLLYIGNILALREWYRHVRSRFVRDAFDRAVLDGGLANLDLVLKERIKRLGDVAEKFEASFRWLEANGGAADEIETQKRFHAAWPEIREQIESLDFPVSDFVQSVATGKNYIETIQALSAEPRAAGQAWLQGVVDCAGQRWG
ncbi:UDP-N-acetylglucosamine pyrophosphorylase [Pontiella sp.]|uniref:UDP-N-acetylglucosamine pyrophosphorylase n=1 Tax=Pontiella sp. TaxID=2837462 RepID=UPI0035633741